MKAYFGYDLSGRWLAWSELPAITVEAHSAEEAKRRLEERLEEHGVTVVWSKRLPNN